MNVRSMECISEIDFGEGFLVLIKSDSEAVEKVFSVCFTEHSRVLE